MVVNSNQPSGASANFAPRASENANAAPNSAAATDIFHDDWFDADDGIPNVGPPVNEGGGGGPIVGPGGTAPGGGVVGGSPQGGPINDRGVVGGFFHRIFSGSGSGS